MMEDQPNKIAQLEQTIEQLKKENQRLEEKLNAALDGTGLCLWEQHVPTGKLTIFNMEWGKMLGFQPHELEANVETWKSKLHPDDYELAVGAFESHLNGETEAYQVVHRMIHKDGSHSWVSDRGRIVEYTPDGEPLRIMGTHIDITNEKRYELELAKLTNLFALKTAKLTLALVLVSVSSAAPIKISKCSMSTPTKRCIKSNAMVKTASQLFLFNSINSVLSDRESSYSPQRFTALPTASCDFCAISG